MIEKKRLSVKQINTLFYHQYQVVKDEYNHFSQNTPYQIHSGAVVTSKMIDTKQITKLLQHGSKDLELDINDYLDKLENSTGLTRQFKRQLSFSESSRETKLTKLIEQINLKETEQSTN